MEVPLNTDKMTKTLIIPLDCTGGVRSLLCAYNLFLVIWLEKFDSNLTLKAPITTAADDILKYFFFIFQRQ